MPASIQQTVSFTSFIVTVLALGMPACMIEDGRPEGIIAVSEHGLQSQNGLHLNNGLNLNNGLQLGNGTSLRHGLAAGHGLSLTSGLMSEAGLSSTTGFLTSESGQRLVRYLVECALPFGHSITKDNPLDGSTITFEGYVGLAPAWETGACDQECQEWVSACLMARTNALGETVAIELVASHPAIGPTRTQPDTFVHEEAGFYGNLFLNPPVAYTCRGAQVVQGSHHGRLCGLTPWESCGFRNVANECASLNSCSGKSADTYLDCRDAAGTSFRTITSFTPANY
jgi:hypothetical protein